jgi:signal transduction histidine kinase
MLHEFLTEKRDEIVSRCQAKVAARRSPPPTDANLDRGVPVFLDQLVDTLRLDAVSSAEIGRSANGHGSELLRRGFTVDQVVHDYGDVCQVVTELALELDVSITTAEFRSLNRCLVDAIAGAVTEYGHEHDEVVADKHTERIGVLAHELRNHLNSANLAFEALSSGSVGLSGSIGALLGRSLGGLRTLIDRALAEVRLEAGIQNRERVGIAELIEEVRVPALMDANARGIGLAIEPVEQELVVEADRQTLNSVVTNLLQNAFKFSRRGGTVTLKTRLIAERVLIEVEDECGGLEPGEVEALFRPFEQRNADRTGLGLGLAICLRGVEANGGRLHVHDVPGSGCIFTIDLPRQPPPTPSP